MQTRNGLQEVAELQGALFCCFQGALAQTRGEKEKKQKKKKKNEEGDSTLSQAVPPRRLRTENFSYKNKEKKNSQNPSNTEETHKTTFRFWFFFIGWFGLFSLGGWVLDLKPRRLTRM